MSTDNPVLERLVPEMIENLIKIVVDQKLHGLDIESKFERVRVNRNETSTVTDIICSHEKTIDSTLNSPSSSASSSETEQFKSALGSDLELNPSGSESSSEQATEKDTSNNDSTSSNESKMVKLELRGTEELEANLEDKPNNEPASIELDEGKDGVELGVDLEQSIDLRIRSSIDSIPAALQSNHPNDSPRLDSPTLASPKSDSDNLSLEGRPESPRRTIAEVSPNMQHENLLESSNPVEDISSKIPITDSSLIQMLIS